MKREGLFEGKGGCVHFKKAAFVKKLQNLLQVCLKVSNMGGRGSVIK